ncbi:MAG TPA: hypothetical protein PLN21_02565 [Gemmatales bacterium]|nr:hypothetical protein [Gemmatales bacterium]
MTRRSSEVKTNDRLDGLVYEVQELERQRQIDREMLSGILDTIDELQDEVKRTLCMPQRSQPRVSTAFEEAAVQLERKRAMGIADCQKGSFQQGELFS